MEDKWWMPYLTSAEQRASEEQAILTAEQEALDAFQERLQRSVPSPSL